MDTNGSAQIREGQTVTLECPYCRMLMHVPYHAAGVRATCESCQGIVNFHFVGADAPVTRKSASELILENVLIVVGLVFIFGGIALSIGNRSGAFPTVPFAGFIMGLIGMGILAAALHGGQ